MKVALMISPDFSELAEKKGWVSECEECKVRMSKKCAKCEKTVYPVEELKCLEKIWHKACFKCQVCGMTLNMKNYKGFDKLPYCNAHVPKAKATVVADTPENLRLKANSEVSISSF